MAYLNNLLVFYLLKKKSQKIRDMCLHVKGSSKSGRRREKKYSTILLKSIVLLFK